VRGVIPLTVSGLLKAAGAHPLWQAATIIVGTFILEDAATVLAAMQVQDGKIAWSIALGSLYVGIVLGDIGLYGSGRLASLWPWARRLLPEQRRAVGKEWIEQRVFRVVFISRFVPGARLPTYTSCGYLHARFASFVLAAVLATSIWTTLLFVISRHVGQFLIDHLGAWRWLGAAIFAIIIVLVGRLAVRLQKEPR
jgi:membrane protein DedA with SNARE-associated domain